ncbi:MAG: Asp-tRNA(Asn)/Glu-tRNA(Gln) amidotransferase subunit GatB [Planctomycetes bacterium]|nr:Asp-tRNA(Asn)/Glu-tRNA(Gln) amidotransferase subunit GatB [Planctomycetota bacterium]MBI3847544.1 Asp-tRNA(Asn)/Glu-tRNA(Gln) amidotransferase subunit GatB [Planctomycetota bacterium]
MEWEAVIGCEVHCELSTKTKVFCPCEVRFGAEPNTLVCPVCLGMPGTLPVLNEQALVYAMRAAHALHCTVATHTKFDRKNYFYPDLPKGYQISQYDLPLSKVGWIDIGPPDRRKRIGITRVHLEEDTGKLLHEGADGESFLDMNRCGTPLIEIVSDPDLRTPDETFDYLKELRTTLLALGISDCNMEEGSLRCEPNVSIRPKGQAAFGTKTEIKNLNSFKNVRDALVYELERQRKLIESGGKVVQETLLWDAARGVTATMRSKESAHDYRYFPEPDLPPLNLSQQFIHDVLWSLPELPAVKRERYQRELGLPYYDSDVLVQEPEVARYFEETMNAGAPAKEASNWVMGEVLREAKDRKVEVGALPVTPARLAALIALVLGGTISVQAGREVFREMAATGGDPATIVEKKGLVQISDESALQSAVERAIAAHPQAAADVRAGKEKAMGAIVGAVMKETKGRANPKLASDLVRRTLGVS